MLIKVGNKWWIMVLDTIYCLGLIQSRAIDILVGIGTREVSQLVNINNKYR